MQQNLIAIVNKARGGDLPALGELYDRYAPLVRAVVFDHTGDLHSAGDIVQEVFLAVLKGLSGLKRTDRFPGWLMGIARRKAIDAVRRQATRQSRVLAQKEKAAENPVGAGAKELLSLLRQAIQGLPAEERLVVELFHLESLPVAKVMEIMELPRSTVYAILIRARTRLRKELERFEHSERLP